MHLLTSVQELTEHSSQHSSSHIVKELYTHVYMIVPTFNVGSETLHTSHKSSNKHDKLLSFPDEDIFGEIDSTNCSYCHLK